MAAVARRVREFGTGKARGWHSRRIIAQVMAESFVVGVVGAVMGIALGFGGVALVDAVAPTLSATVALNPGSAPAQDTLINGSGVQHPLAPGSTNTIIVHLAAQVTANALVLAVVLGIACALIACAVWRWHEARLTEFRAAFVGFVFQTFNLLPTLSAVENVEAALVPRRVSSAERRARATQALEAVGLGDRAQHLPSELSGGQQQRVGIARALVKEPKVLLADEPTGNLDDDTRDEIIALLERLWHEHRFILVLVTHDASLAGRAQHVGIMRSGQR